MSTIRVEILPNGLARVYDYGLKWAALYARDGEYRGGGVDSPRYRAAALAAFARPAGGA
jgi:hypothetical protein